MSRPVLTIAVLAALLILSSTIVVAKGFGGYGRSSGGGYYRSSKLGYYSRTNRYYVTGMYWRSGYNYGFAGPKFRHGAPPLTNSELANIICKRDVRVDSTNADNFRSSLVMNSTQNCYKEKSETPGSTLNEEVETLMLNRFRFQYRADPYPTVDMVIYPDKDITIGSVNNTMRLHTLNIRRRSQNTNIASIDLGALSWSPCSLNECYSRSQPGAHVEWGYPSSRFMEGGRIFFSSIQSTYNNALEITMRFWLSSDFNEDPNFDHVFLMPSAIKWDVIVKVIDTSAFPNMKQCPVTSSADGCFDAILEGTLAAPLSGAGSTVMRQAAPAGKLATEYEPQKMERVQLGTTTDINNGKGSYVSWSSSSSRKYLCVDRNTDWTCSEWVPYSPTDGSKLSTVCTGAATDPSYCNAPFLRPGQVGYALKWNLGNVNDEQPTDWYLNFGFVDPSVGAQADMAGAASMAITIIVALAVSMLVVF